MRVLRTLLGDYPATHALRQGRVGSSLIQLDFADVAVPSKAFTRVVRDLEFDVAELALMTLLMAQARDLPLRLLPVVVFSRNPLQYLVYRTDRGRLEPRDLAGRRIGARAYTTTTAAWVRALLSDEFGVDLDSLQWLTYEEPHVAGAREPANVRRHASHADLAALLRDGTIDAAIVDPVPQGSDIATVVRDPDEAWRTWRRRTGAQTINHVVVIRESLAEDLAIMDELLRLFRDSGRLAGSPVEHSFFVGLDAIQPSLDAATIAARAQHLI